MDGLGFIGFVWVTGPNAPTNRPGFRAESAAVFNLRKGQSQDKLFPLPLEGIHVRLAEDEDECPNPRPCGPGRSFCCNRKLGSFVTVSGVKESQWGGQPLQDTANRFSGFDPMRKTAEAVRSRLATQVTPLEVGCECERTV
jgi:hypothetical protein